MLSHKNMKSLWTGDSYYEDSTDIHAGITPWQGADARTTAESYGSDFGAAADAGYAPRSCEVSTVARNARKTTTFVYADPKTSGPSVVAAGGGALADVSAPSPEAHEELPRKGTEVPF